MRPVHDEMPFLDRLAFAFACFFRVLFDGAFAARADAVRELPAATAERRPASEARSAPAEPAAAQTTPAPQRTPPQTTPPPTTAAPKTTPAASEAPADLTPALQLLGLLQREGRFIDFVEQDVAGFSDADIGAAARVVHEGCRRALRGHLTVEPVRSEAEGTRVTVPAGFPPAEVKLTGNVQGHGPYAGTLAHRGWRARALTLPTPMAGHDARVLAPAEVEL